jgi:short-subunit dehydrogenase
MTLSPTFARPKTVLITGASSGIGAAFAEVFAAERFDLVLTARREDRLRTVASGLERRHGVRIHVIGLDLADAGAPGALCEAIAARGLAIDALVNNAGHGVPGVFLMSPLERHAAMRRVMVDSTVELTYRLLPGMIERAYGRIINVASLVALAPAPAGHTLYAASKAFIVKFSESLADEVRSAGVHVTALCPGFTYSEFHDITGTRAQVSQLPSWLWMDAATVARQGFEASMAGVRIHIPGRVNRTIALMARYLPQRLLVSIARLTAKTYRKT